MPNMNGCLFKAFTLHSSIFSSDKCTKTLHSKSLDEFCAIEDLLKIPRSYALEQHRVIVNIIDGKLNIFSKFCAPNIFMPKCTKNINISKVILCQALLIPCASHSDNQSFGAALIY